MSNRPQIQRRKLLPLSHLDRPPPRILLPHLILLHHFIRMSRHNHLLFPLQLHHPHHILPFPQTLLNRLIHLNIPKHFLQLLLSLIQVKNLKFLVLDLL